MDIRPSSRRLRSVISLLLVGSLSGCLCRLEDQPPIPYKQGTWSTNQYESTRLTETWLHFPGGRRYEIHHCLGTKPTILTYLSFSSLPAPEEGSGEYTLGGGNLVLIQQTTDEVLQIYNDTCVEHYVRVVATIEDGTEVTELSEECLALRGTNEPEVRQLPNGAPPNTPDQAFCSIWR